MDSIIQSTQNFVSEFSALGNTGADYLKAMAFIVVTTICFRTVRHILLPKIQKFVEQTTNGWDDQLISIIDTFFARGFVYFVGIVLSIQIFLTPPELVATWLRNTLFIWLAIKMGLALSIILDFVINKWLALSETTPFNQSLITFITTMGKFVIWALVAITVLGNLGFNIIALVTSFGLMGLVLPIALKDTFSDLFATISIHADKPFDEGDTIEVGGNLGEVEHIGIKTTRIRSPEGQEITIPNTDLTSSIVVNHGRRDRRRVLQKITVAGETPNTLIETLVDYIERTIRTEKHVQFDRVHPTKFSDFGFDIEWHYKCDDSCYKKLLQAQANINLKIKAFCEEANVKIPYPTHTVLLEESKQTA